MILRRIKYANYDEFYNSLDYKNFFKNHNNIVKQLENLSEDVMVDGKTIDINLNEKEYLDIIKKSTSKGDASIKIAKKLFDDFKADGKNLPFSLMYEKELWTYIDIVVFFNVVKIKYIDEDKDEESNIKKIQRVYLNDGGLSKLDRTGLRNLWVLANLTYYNNSFDLLQTAWDFIDPFKAIQECTIGTNHDVLKAFAMSIKKVGCDPRIKNQVYKTKIPKHIRNYVCLHNVESLGTVELISEEFAKEIKKVLSTK